MRKSMFLALSVLAGAVLFTSATKAADLSGWQAGCAYTMPSGSYGSGAAMMPGGMYCTSMTFCQKMMNQHSPNMMVMACFGFTPSDRKP